MNQIFRSSSNLWHRGLGLSRAQLVHSIDLTAYFSSSSAEIDSLQNRILNAGDSSMSTASVYQQWLEEGKDVKLSELRNIVKRLRYYRRFKQALQISDLMTGQWGFELTSVDVAVRLELISKVHGLEAADAFFNGLSGSPPGHQVYGALLNCYAHAKQVEKAEALLEKMKAMGFVKTAVSYNVMLTLYSQMGKYEELDMLMQEMEKRGIVRTMFTYTIRLQAYVACSDIEGMEKLLSMMTADPRIKMDFHFCIAAANGYLKAGFVEKTLMMLKKSEQLINNNSRKTAYEILLTLYTAIGHKADLYRVWDMYKRMGRFINTGYIAMISSLVKLDDIDGAEKIWEEWNSGKVNFDIRIPNLLISAYSRKGFPEKAEAFINKMVESGEEPDSASWDHLATGYRLQRQMGKAVEMTKRAISTSKPGRKPTLRTLSACLKHLKDQGDKEAVDELLKIIKEHYHFSRGACNVLSSCIEDGNIGTGQ